MARIQYTVDGRQVYRVDRMVCGGQDGIHGGRMVYW
jgi:hypothetical protein